MALNQWDRGSKNNGVNAYKKGNRTDSRRETAHFKRYTNALSEGIAYYKEIAEKERNRKKYRQEDLIDIYSRLKEYIKECRNDIDEQGNSRPITIAGLILAAGVSKTEWYNMLKGEYDYKLYEYIDIHNIDLDTVNDYIDGIPVIRNDENKMVMLIEYTAICQKAVLAVENQTEERLYRKGRVGDIFALKAVHGWREEQPHTVNNTLVIASEEQARKAIELLK